MKGKWAKGIAPRFFSWIIKDKLAVSERPGGYARNHRRVRRQEEILWLRGEGFTRVVSLLTSPHNLHAYDELDMSWAHIPFGPHDDPHLVLPDLYAQLREWMATGERLLVHQEELSDRLMGVVSGYLRWSGLVPEGPQAISVVERIMHRQMGPDGRELVAMAPQLAGAGGCVGTITTRARTSEQMLARAKQSAATAAAAMAAAVIEAPAVVEPGAELEPKPALESKPELEPGAALEPEPALEPEVALDPEPALEPEPVDLVADKIVADEIVTVEDEVTSEDVVIVEEIVMVEEVVFVEAPVTDEPPPTTSEGNAPLEALTAAVTEDDRPLEEDEHHAFELQGVPDVPSESIAGGSSNGAGDRDTI